MSRTSVQTSRLVARSPIFYGWVILAAAAIGLIMSSPGQTYSVSIFIEHFIRDLGFSRGFVSTLYTVGTLIASFGLPYIGRQFDRHGPRLMVGILSVGLALACLFMSWVQNGPMLVIGFVLIRLFGAGGLWIVSTNVINYWWVRRRGLMLSIAGVLMALLGSGSFPSLINFLISQYGWRTSYMLLGGLVAILMLPIGLVFFRGRPELFGLLPDGAKVPLKDDPDEVSILVEENWTRDEAIRTPAFWIFSLGIASIAMLVTGLNFHMVSIFDDAGLSAAAAAAVYLPIAITGSIVRLVSGALVDRISPSYLLSVALIGQAVSLFMAPRLNGTSSALIYGIVLGMMGGLNTTVTGVVWAKYFGREHLGAITGIAALINVAGSSLGPMPMGIARDVFGNYTLALTALAALPLVLAVVVLFIPRPQRAMTDLLIRD
jgi:MFS transporter, OFA family, oxalate/formate antiporter